MSHFLGRATVVLLAIAAVAVGFLSIAEASSFECSINIKRGSSGGTVIYQWCLDSNGGIVPCTVTQCSTVGNVCRAEAVPQEGHPGVYDHYCDCGDEFFACTTIATSNYGPWGIITSASCVPSATQCPAPHECHLLPVGSPDPNGMSTVRCFCQ